VNSIWMEREDRFPLSREWHRKKWEWHRKKREWHMGRWEWHKEQ